METKQTKKPINLKTNAFQPWGYRMSLSMLAPVVQRPDNFIQWISHYPTVSICEKISVFRCKQANMHSLTTA